MSADAPTTRLHQSRPAPNEERTWHRFLTEQQRSLNRLAALRDPRAAYEALVRDAERTPPLIGDQFPP